jgi:retinol dehydrogenase 12
MIMRRYPITKLLEVLGVRELASLITSSSKPRVIVNCVTPGACHSDFGRERSGAFTIMAFEVIKFLIARTTEVGSRTLVAGAEVGEESHGEYMADGKVAP